MCVISNNIAKICKKLGLIVDLVITYILPNSNKAILLISRLNSRFGGVSKAQLSLKKAVSRRKFNFASEQRIQNLQQIQMKKKTEAKCKWAISAFVDWREERLRVFNYDYSIYMCDLRNLEQVTKGDLAYCLCRFVPEVTKSRGDGPYPGKTLYQMVIAIQKHLWVNKIHWRLVEDPEFSEFKTVLDNVMQERTRQNVGVTKKQAQVITYEFEEKLWKEGVLGEDTPDKLRQTVLFLIGINLFLRAVDKHYNLRRDVPGKDSQLSVQYNDFGDKCIVYKEDNVTKTRDGGLADMNYECKEVWIFPNKENVQHCPVRVIQKYLSLCPKNYFKKDNFYLQSLQKPTPVNGIRNK